MKARMLKWAGLILGGSTLFAAGVEGCMADALRSAGDELNEAADRVDGSDKLSNVVESIEQLFD